jgi:type III secretion protein V
MSFADAVDRYTILTAGDGLVTQIPSLFVSIAAGVLTTRVSGNEKGNLGGEIVGQIFGQPTALLVTGLILLGFLLVPGFPPGQFLLLGAVVGGVGYVLLRQRRRRASGARAPVPQMRGDDTLIDARVPSLMDDHPPAITVPLLVRVSDDFGARLSAKRFAQLLEELRARLLEDLGLPFPGVRLVRDARLVRGAYRVLVYDVPVSDGLAPPGMHLFVEETGATLPPSAPLPPGAKEDVSLEWLGRAAWIATADKAGMAWPGWRHIDADSLLAAELQRVIRSRPHEFLGLQDTQRLLQRAESDISDLVKEIAKAVPLHRVTDVLRRLLAEGVPIRNLRAIGECLVMWGTREKDVVMLTELVRVELGRWIAQRHARGARQLAAILIHPDTEMLFKRSIQQNASGSFLAVDPDERNRFCAELGRLIGEAEANAPRPVVLTTMDLRRYVYKLIETALPGTVVLSYEEIAAHVDLAVRGTVGAGGHAAAAAQ